MNDTWKDFYAKVYAQDSKPEGAHGWIQWRRTDVCIDLYCQCGAHLHFDGEFMYFVACPHCKQAYAAGQTIKLIPLSHDDIELGRIRQNIKELEPEQRSKG